MYEEYPISGIKQSYRHTSRSKTIVLPMLMIAVVASMVIFYVKGKPADSIDEEPVIIAVPTPKVIEDSPRNIAEEEIPEVISPPVEEPDAPVTEPANTDTKTPQDEPPKTVENSAEPAPVKKVGFTPWMAPLALDTYIRAKTDGNGKTFWEIGHWIIAVEGRWNNENREFRIAYEKIPEIETWQWRYKVNQTQTEFAMSVSEMVEQGYTLVQTQTFKQPDGDHRYQGVWHRQLARPMVVESKPAQNAVRDAPAPAQQQSILPSSRSTSSDASESRGLNVNRLNFR